jgi:hypothetical protein
MTEKWRKESNDVGLQAETRMTDSKYISGDMR